MDLAVDYDHELNRHIHTVSGASEVLRLAFPGVMPASVLDVGCGSGTWLRAAQERGVDDLFGVDGVSLDPARLHIDKSLTRQVDLNQPLALGRRFELVVCLEVVEHLEPSSAATIVASLCRHADDILFSAAAPGQAGTHHINCQWPSYWQDLFNLNGFACRDDLRWKMWDNELVEPWYRQNIFRASLDRDGAGREERIVPVIHPDALSTFSHSFFDQHRDLIERGGLPWPWYLTAPIKAARAKLESRIVR